MDYTTFFIHYHEPSGIFCTLGFVRDVYIQNITSLGRDSRIY